MSPFFIVTEVNKSLEFYRDRLGFVVWHRQPNEEPFFAIVRRGAAMLFLKSGVAEALPNWKRDPEMRWDAYVSVQDPDGLAEEFVGREVEFSVGLKDTEDGLRGFEVMDPDGYVLFFGRVR